MRRNKKPPVRIGSSSLPLLDKCPTTELCCPYTGISILWQL